MKNRHLVTITALALFLGIGLLHFGYLGILFFFSGLSLALGLVYLILLHENKRNVLVTKIYGATLAGFSLAWVLIAFVNPARTPTAWMAKAEQKHRQEVKAEKERLEKLSLLVPDIDKDLNQAGVTVTVMSDLELVLGRLYVFRGQHSDDKTERLVFYEMPDSRCIMETSRAPKKGDKLSLMVRTFRATDAWYAPLDQSPLATIYFVKNNCI